MPNDEFFMKRALELAARGQGKTSPNPMVGAVVVRENKLIAEDWHRASGEKHAERLALEKAGTAAKGATLYVNLEPCCHMGKTPACTDIIISSSISRVVAAVKDPFPEVSGKGLEILKKAGITVELGLLEKEARRLNEVFFCFHENKRPFVMIKWAMSLDGRTSTDTGVSQWITGKNSRLHVHRLRSYYDAIGVGVQTVLQDNPLLTVRMPGYKGKQPVCVILDEKLRIPAKANLFQKSHRIIIVTSALKGNTLLGRAKKLETAGAEIMQMPLVKKLIPIPSIMKALYQEQIQSIFVEGGRHVAGSFVKEGIVDKFGVFIAPKIIGGAMVTSPLIFEGPSSLENALNLRDTKVTMMDPDIYLEGYPKII